MRRLRLVGRLCFGVTVCVRWRAVVARRAMMVRRETVRSCWGVLVVSMRLSWEVEGVGAYEDEGPGDIVFFQVEVVDEEDEDAGDDDGGEELGES